MHQLPQLHELLNVEAGPAEPWLRVKASPDGRRVLARGFAAGRAAGPGAALVFEADAGGGSRQVPQQVDLGLGDEESLRSQVSWAPDGSWVAFGTSAHGLKLVNLRRRDGAGDQQPQAMDLFHGHGHWPEVTWSPDGSRLAAWLPPVARLRQHDLGAKKGGANSKVCIWAAAAPDAAPLELQHGDTQLHGLAWSPDGRSLLTWDRRCRSVGEPGRMQLWYTQGTADGSFQAIPLCHADKQVCDAAWSPDGCQVATICADGRARVWEVRWAVQPCELCGERHTKVIHELEHGVNAGTELLSVTWSPDGSCLLTASARGRARVHRVREDGVLVFEVSHGTGTQPRDRGLWTRGHCRSLVPGDLLEQRPPPKVWDLALPGASPQQFDTAGPGHVAVARSWSPTSSLVLVVTHGTRLSPERVETSQVWLWTPRTGQSVELPALRDRSFHEASWSPDGSWMVVACDDWSAQVLDVRRGTLLCAIEHRQDRPGAPPPRLKGLVSAHFLPCGRRVVVTVRGKDLGGDAEDGDCVRILGPHHGLSNYQDRVARATNFCALAADPSAALHGALRLLQALEMVCDPGEAPGLRALAQALGMRAKEADDEMGLMPRAVGLAPSELVRHRGQFLAAALWSSCERATFQGVPREFSWLVNYALDTDDADLLEAVWPFILSFGRLAAAGRGEAVRPVPWPPGPCAATAWTWRGGGFCDFWRDHFAVGQRHRIPGYVASSSSREEALAYLPDTAAEGLSPIEWCFELPTSLGEVLFVSSDMKPSSAHRGDGDDYILPPHTVVEVVNVHWSMPKASTQDPHRVTLRVSPRSAEEAPELPYAPWR